MSEDEFRRLIAASRDRFDPSLRNGNVDRQIERLRRLASGLLSDHAMPSAARRSRLSRCNEPTAVAGDHEASKITKSIIDLVSCVSSWSHKTRGTVQRDVWWLGVPPLANDRARKTGNRPKREVAS